MLGRLFFIIYALPLPVAVTLIVLSVILWAWTAAVLWTSSRISVRALSLFLFLFFLFAIFYLTIARGRVSYSALILRPFQSFEDAKIQPELYRSMLMNVLLFLPFGVFLPFALAGERHASLSEENVPKRCFRHPILITLALAILCSMLVETIQYKFSLGRAETDDVIMNTLGTLVGTLSCLLARWLEKQIWKEREAAEEKG